MTRWLILVLLVACGCPNKHTAATGGGTTGSGTATNPGARCEAIRTKVEQLYRGEAETREPQRVAEAVADNTAMVMSDCTKAPDQVMSCIESVRTVAELETRCLTPLDDEGTEGEALRK